MKMRLVLNFTLLLAITVITLAPSLSMATPLPMIKELTKAQEKFRSRTATDGEAAKVASEMAKAVAEAQAKGSHKKNVAYFYEMKYLFVYLDNYIDKTEKEAKFEEARERAAAILKEIAPEAIKGIKEFQGTAEKSKKMRKWAKTIRGAHKDVRPIAGLLYYHGSHHLKFAKAKVNRGDTSEFNNVENYAANFWLAAELDASVEAQGPFRAMGLMFEGAKMKKLKAKYIEASYENSRHEKYGITTSHTNINQFFNRFDEGKGEEEIDNDWFYNLKTGQLVDDALLAKAATGTKNRADFDPDAGVESTKKLHEDMAAYLTNWQDASE